MKNALFLSVLLFALGSCSSDSSTGDVPVTVNNSSTSRLLSECTNVSSLNESAAVVPATDKHVLFQWNNVVLHDPYATYTAYIEVRDGVCRGTFSYTFPIYNFFGTSSYYLSPKFTDFCFEWRIVIDGSNGCHSETEWNYFTYAS